MVNTAELTPDFSSPTIVQGQRDKRERIHIRPRIINVYDALADINS